MLQKLINHNLSNEFKLKKPNADDIVLVMHNRKLLASKNDTIDFPRHKDGNFSHLIYLFNFDDKAVYLLFDEIEIEGYEYYKVQELRAKSDTEMLFLAVTAFHLGLWYEKNKYCGCCGNELKFKQDERALVCSKCNNVIYPTISPAVIVGIISKDKKKILLTRYNQSHSSYNRYALVAGFTEIGEDLEGTVKREVKEEVGLDVSDIRYFGSQPWGFSSSILVGFICTADDNIPITRQEDELSEACWFKREDVPESLDGNVSLTWDIISSFKNGKI